MHICSVYLLGQAMCQVSVYDALNAVYIGQPCFGTVHMSTHAYSQEKLLLYRDYRL